MTAHRSGRSTSSRAWASALSLNTTQEQALQLIFAWADGQGLELVDLPDLRSVISFLTSEEGKDELAMIGGVSKATAGVILPASSRVIDAITAAGGALEDADLDAINLARPVVDGEHIRVAALGQSPPEPSGGAESAQSACVQLDTASATDLQTLPGIGPALAQRIIDYRATHPHIPSVDALDEVPGIGHALIEKIRPGVCP